MRRTPWPPPRRSAAILAVLVMAAGLTPTASTPAGASTRSVSTPAKAAGELVELTGLTSGSHTVTLITGDRVKLTGSGGHYGLAVEAARRGEGPPVSFATQAGPDGVFVIPTDAAPAVRAGTLDRRLFDVKYLAENGYADDAVKQVPLIVQYPANRPAAAIRSAADALPASTPTRDLHSIHGSALEVPKAQAGKFWSGVRGTTAAPGGTSALSAGVTKIWLDQKVQADLDVSVPLIGAPTAWQAGQDGKGVKVAILDTGVDATHPDLAGRIAESKSFIDGGSAVDGNGHGTHVASTIAGSGAASGGKYKGVAPGASLVIGKVLDDNGDAQESWILEGMQWAATSGAKVVSMSLGTKSPSDGHDPLSQAVEDLTAATGTLFVIAAGNTGPGVSTVVSPGAAASALTVAATDKSDGLAEFSSRGPTLDSALKPDIAAPGVDIVAARAAGTNLGTPVGDGYTTLSGTSMATPHVAGSAAILAERHPDWKAEQLKAALMSTAKDDGFTVYEQGSGRVDIGRADTQQVFATTANLGYGSVDAGQAPAGKELSYTNIGDQAVTLQLVSHLTSASGQSVPGALTVAQSIVVPAHGTAGTTVTLAAADLPVGRYSGAVTATADGVQLRTPVGLVREPPKVTLTIRTLGLDGKPVPPKSTSIFDVTGDGGAVDGGLQEVSPGVSQVRVPAGAYSVVQGLDGIDASYRPMYLLLTNPEVTVTGDTKITLDARTAQELTFSTPKPAEPMPGQGTSSLWLERTTLDGITVANGVVSAPFVRQFATPTRKVSRGSFLLTSARAYGQPEATLTMLGRHPIALHPVIDPHVGEESGGFYTKYLSFQGTKAFDVVDVGTGRPDELAGKNLRGKLALLDDDRVCALRMDRIHNLRDAGAAGILAWPSGEPGSCLGGPTIPESPVPTDLDQSTDIGIPYLSVPPGEARALADRLTHERVQIKVTGVPQKDTAYSYQLFASEKGRVPASLHYRMTERNLADVSMDLHASTPNNVIVEESVFNRTQLIQPISSLPPVQAPTTRHQYVGPLYDDVIHRRQLTPQDLSLPAWWSFDVFDRPVRVTERRGTGVVTPGAVTAPDSVYAVPRPGVPALSQNVFAVCALCRQGDNFYPLFVRANGAQQFDGSGFSPDTTHLYANGKEIPIGAPKPGVVGYTLPKESANYRLTIDDLNTTAAWTFSSGTVTKDVKKPGYVCVETVLSRSTVPCRPEPLVFAAYDLGASQAPDNTVRAGGAHTFQVRVYHSPGAVQQPKIAGARLWYSTDDGTHWQRALLVPGKDGRFTATAVYPRRTATSGAVSLRIEAWDASGNRLDQTTRRAFDLR
ncbi:S8 family serine peptidase [Kribbella sp. NPDC051952]|uniref:S8 family serine peptidase n=1 Tax=Kribbella sp. NPDC051952 TaxID=3154851 RepID=UPI00342EA4BD